MLRIGRLVEDVPPSNPRISLVSSGDFLPEVDRTSLEVSVLEEQGSMNSGVGVPCKRETKSGVSFDASREKRERKPLGDEQSMFWPPGAA